MKKLVLLQTDFWSLWQKFDKLEQMYNSVGTIKRHVKSMHNAFAQSYFAVQTRKQELIEERIAYIQRTEARGKLRESENRLSQNIYERGVDDAGL